jgi:hypothetical protein
MNVKLSITIAVVTIMIAVELALILLNQGFAAKTTTTTSQNQMVLPKAHVQATLDLMAIQIIAKLQLQKPGKVRVKAK